MKIYLGGKIAGRSRGQDWRNDIVSDDFSSETFGDDFYGQDGIDINGSCGTDSVPDHWPVLKGAIFGRHDYVGPFLVSCDHGCFHSGDHGTSIAFGPDPDDLDGAIHSQITQLAQRDQIVRLCWQAMASADFLFFWLDDPSAYGSLAELVWVVTAHGFMSHELLAKGEKPREIQVVVASSSWDAVDQMWFTFHLVRQFGAFVEFVTAPTALGAFEKALERIEEQPTVSALDLSPIEQQFMDAWRVIYSNDIVPQYNVPGFPYRVDFAFPDDKVAVELDGYEYHNSKEQFTKDRQRQRELEMAGWRFIRFSGREIYQDVDRCIRQAYEFWQAIMRKEVAA